MNTWIKTLVNLIFLHFGLIVAGAAEPVDFYADLEPEILASRIVNAMSDQEALGQILMFGYPGELPDSNIINWIKQRNLGAIKIFGYNASNIDVLARTIGVYQNISQQSRFRIPLLVATDQEGGLVRHVKGRTSQTPGNMALGADPVPGDALETGRIIGQELAEVGINMNFAPMVDIFIDPRSDVVGTRAFISNPSWAGILGLAFARGQQEFGVISTAKHFPGHGDTADDSHGTLPIIQSNLQTLLDRDMIPYKMLIKENIPAIMVGHLAIPSITKEPIPATISKIILTDILRGNLGFKGVVITDDLFMVGARIDGTQINMVAYKSLLAGADLLLISQNKNNQQRTYNRFIREMNTDKEFNAKVRQAALRVLQMKANWLKGPNAVTLTPKPSKEIFESADTENFLINQAARSITLIKDAKYPVKPDESGDVILAGSYSQFFIEGSKRYPNARQYQLQESGTRKNLIRMGRDLTRIARNYDTVIVLLSSIETAILLNELKALADRVIVISMFSPAYLDNIPWVKTALAAYGSNKESLQAAFAALCGDFKPEGKLPIPLQTISP